MYVYIYIDIYTHVYLCIFVLYFFFLKRKGDCLGDMREPLKKKPHLECLACNNCNLACLFRAGFHIFFSATQGVNSALSPSFLSKPRNREKGKEKEEKKEREKPHLLLPCFGITKRGKQIKLLPLHLLFLIFSTNEGRRREKTPFFPPIFIFFAVFFFLVSASPRMEKKTKNKTPSFLS